MKFTHHDLRWNTSVPLAFDEALVRRHPATEAALSAGRSGCMKEIPTTAHAVRVDVSGMKDGAAFFSFYHSATRAGGQPLTPMYWGIVTCSLPEAPYAWRYILSLYLPFVVSAAPGAVCGAPGLMPKDVPWLCTFPDVRFMQLCKDDRCETRHLVRAMGAALLQECYAVCPAERREAPLDLEGFPELREWE